MSTALSSCSSLSLHSSHGPEKPQQQQKQSGLERSHTISLPVPASPAQMVTGLPEALLHSGNKDMEENWLPY